MNNKIGHYFVRLSLILAAVDPPHLSLAENSAVSGNSNNSGQTAGVGEIFNMTSASDDVIEKRKSVREFFDTLMDKQQSSGTTTPKPLQPPTPIIMPFALPMPPPPPPPPPTQSLFSSLSSLGFGYPNAPPSRHYHRPSYGPMERPSYGPPPPPPPMSYGPPQAATGHIHNYALPPPPPPPSHMYMSPSSHSNYGPQHSMGPSNYGPPMRPLNYGSSPNYGHSSMNYGPPPPSQSSSAGLVNYMSPFGNSAQASNQYEMRPDRYNQHTGPVMFAMPVSALSMPYNSNPENDFGDTMSPSTKYALFAEPFDGDGDEEGDDIFSRPTRYKVIPIERFSFE